MSEVKEKMNKTIEDLIKKVSTLRTNRANTDMINNIQVKYYGSIVPLQQLASISVPEPTQFSLNVFDQGAVKEIEQAIINSSLQLNPQTDGTHIRIMLPELTEERRNDLVKLLKQMGEDSKISIRNIRRDSIDKLKVEEKSKEITEDDFKKSQTEIQNTTDSFIFKIDETVKNKEKEILTI